MEHKNCCICNKEMSFKNQDDGIDKGYAAAQIQGGKWFYFCEEHDAKAKAKEQGYDLAKCLETVMKGDSLSQCTRANGYGLEKLYCKQHSVKHKAKES